MQDSELICHSVSASTIPISPRVCVADTCAGIATLGTSKGLLELYHVPADSSTPYVSGNEYSAPGVGFGHVGFTVPDVAQALERASSFGYEIIKPLNEAKVDQMGMPDEVVQGKHGEVAEGYKHVFKQLAFVKDPDVSVYNANYFGRMLIVLQGLLGRVRTTGRKVVKNSSLSHTAWAICNNNSPIPRLQAQALLCDSSFHRSSTYTVC